MTAVKNKVSDVGSLVKKADCDTKISEIGKKVAVHNHGKYITTPEFNKLSAENFAAILTNLVADLVTDFDTKIY